MQHICFLSKSDVLDEAGNNVGPSPEQALFKLPCAALILM